MFLTKIDTLGNMIWSKHYKEDIFNFNYLSPNYITHHYDKNEIILSANNLESYIFLLKADTSGNILLNKTYLNPYDTWNSTIINAIVPVKNNLYMSLYGQIQLVMIDSLGNIVWQRTHDSEAFNHFFIWQKNGKIISGGTIGSALIYEKNETDTRKHDNTYSSFPNPYYAPVYNKSNTTITTTGVPTGSIPIKIIKIDSSMTFECPTTSINNKDDIIIRDTTSAFSVIIPTYTATVLGGFRSEPLNLEWTFECGKVAPSSVIHQNTPTINFVVYPNPAQEQITIRTDLKNYEVRVWDSYGKLLHNIFNIQQTDYTFPIQYLAQGVYHIECIANNQHYVQPFVKIQ
jgi:hypothetical protein